MLKDWCRLGVYAAETISLATQAGVIRSVDSPSTGFLTALVNIELNSLLRKPLMTLRQHFHVAAFQLRKSNNDVMKASDSY